MKTAKTIDELMKRTAEFERECFNRQVRPRQPQGEWTSGYRAGLKNALEIVEREPLGYKTERDHKVLERFADKVAAKLYFMSQLPPTDAPPTNPDSMERIARSAELEKQAHQPQGEWTREPPKKEGWFWWRSDRSDELQLVKTYWQWLPTDTSPRKILWALIGHSFVGHWRGSVQITGGEWYSTPIAPPLTNMEEVSNG